jgi:hypothetical protein
MRERFLASIRADTTFAATLESVRALSTDELIAEAVATCDEPRTSATVASAAIAQ